MPSKNFGKTNVKPGSKNAKKLSGRHADIRLVLSDPGSKLIHDYI